MWYKSIIIAKYFAISTINNNGYVCSWLFLEGLGSICIICILSCKFKFYRSCRLYQQFVWKKVKEKGREVKKNVVFNHQWQNWINRIYLYIPQSKDKSPTNQSINQPTTKNQTNQFKFDSIEISKINLYYFITVNWL